MAEGDELRHLQGLIVEEPKYRIDVPVFKIGEYAIGYAGYLHAFNRGELWFIPISNSPKEDKMREIIDTQLESCKSVCNGLFETDDDTWLVEVPRLLSQAQIIALSMFSPKRPKLGHFKGGGIEARFPNFEETLNIRIHRVDSYNYGVTISLFQDPDESGPIDIISRRQRLKELTSLLIPQNGLPVYIAGLKTVISHTPVAFEW